MTYPDPPMRQAGGGSFSGFSLTTLRAAFALNIVFSFFVHAALVYFFFTLPLYRQGIRLPSYDIYSVYLRNPDEEALPPPKKGALALKRESLIPKKGSLTPKKEALPPDIPASKETDSSASDAALSQVKSEPQIAISKESPASDGFPPDGAAEDYSGSSLGVAAPFLDILEPSAKVANEPEPIEKTALPQPTRPQAVRGFEAAGRAAHRASLDINAVGAFSGASIEEAVEQPKEMDNAVGLEYPLESEGSGPSEMAEMAEMAEMSEMSEMSAPSGQLPEREVVAKIETGDKRVLILEAAAAVSDEPQEKGEIIAEIETGREKIQVVKIRGEENFERVAEKEFAIMDGKKPFEDVYILKTEEQAVPPRETIIMEREPKDAAGGKEQEGIFTAISKAIEVEVSLGSEANVSVLFLKKAHPASKERKSRLSSEVKPLEESSESGTPEGGKSLKKTFSIERADAGVYTFVIRSEKGAVRMEIGFRLDGSSGERAKSYKDLEVGEAGTEFKFVMPEAVFWDDEDYFTGSIESGDSVTKFNSATGLYWVEKKATGR